ncbi:MAG: ATP-dependent DNA helicase RecG [Patescibacteria group bacterium]
MNLLTAIGSIPRIGPAYEKKLKQMGITTVRDLLFHFPRAYEDLSRVIAIRDVKEGITSCVMGKILAIQESRTFRKHLHITEALIEDATGTIKAIWFNQPYLKNVLKRGDLAYLAGKIVRDKYGFYFSNPSYEKCSGEEVKLTHTGRIIPLYPETAGVSSRWLRSIIKMALAMHGKETGETLPDTILREQGFLPLARALWQVHFPDSLELAKQAQRRFSFEELFYILLFILSERKKIASVKAPVIPFDPERMQKFTKSLPFQLTNDQKKAAWHILKDMEKPRPMNRLLQGDVGSGKTVVAAMAALSVVKAGYQAAFLAPTEILAQQHFKTIAQLLTPFRMTIGLLTGTLDRLISPKLPNDFIEISRAKLLERAKNQKIDVLVGTHSLIQDQVRFGNLALVVVDEQHRFGVKQRAQLLHRSTLIPHLLSMSATPIPRTLALTIYGDLDLTIIKELPKGRKKVFTEIVPPAERNLAYQAVRGEVKKGRQVFVICPRIESAENQEMTNDLEQTAKRNVFVSGNSSIWSRPSSARRWSEAKAVKEEYEKLSTQVFPDLRLAMLHGKMPAKEKEQVMRKLKYGKIDILVSTSVVEVGVDVPNATVMMIEGAEHFGLAQLHQLRGRVGRSEHQSYCFLFTESPSRNTRKRLKALKEAESGFELAEHDLKIRGPGDFTGTKQWGIPDFAMQQLTNLQLVEEVRESAKSILEEDITLTKYPQLKAKVQDLRTKLHLE